MNLAPLSLASAEASDPKVDLHVWDPSDAVSMKESIVVRGKTGSTFRAMLYPE
jgi:hypothetical protein